MPTKSFATQCRTNSDYSDGVDGGDLEGVAAVPGQIEVSFPARALPQWRGTRQGLLASALLFSEGKEERDYSECCQHCRDGESRRGNFGTRVKTLFKLGSHADQKEQKRQIDQN
jgi:hypothetical protein